MTAPPPLEDLQSGMSLLDLHETPPWKDITAFLADATQDMDEGQLIHLQSFSLFDAMTAIEIMDPRMDTGMLLKENEPVDYDIRTPRTPAQVLWIVDHLLNCEMAWLSGHSLAQTVYTSLYFHHIPQLLHQTPVPARASASMDDVMLTVVRAAVLATVRCCRYIWTEMSSGNVYEEEDFTTNLFGLSIYDEIMDVDVFNDIRLALLLLQDKMDGQENNEWLAALHQRLTVRQHFLKALMFLAQPRCSHIKQVSDNLHQILEKPFDCLDKGDPVHGAFDPNINRKLTSQAPPRSVSLPSHTDAYNQFIRLIRRLHDICSITTFPSVASLMNFFAYFASTQPYPDALSRSKLNSLFFDDGAVFGIMPIKQFIVNSITDYTSPPADWFDMNHAPGAPPATVMAKTALNQFLDQHTTLPFIDFFKIQCHNRARQRRLLCKVLNDWEMLQTEAYENDLQMQALRPKSAPAYHFSLWVYNIKLIMMERILLMGFELDLYGAHEYTMIYWYHWYVQSVLANYHQHTAHDALDDDHPDTPIDSYAQFARILNGAKKEMSLGVFKLLLAMEKTRQLTYQPLRFDHNETRFMHRLKPFVALASPPFLPYERFVQDADTEHLSIDVLLDSAAADFTHAKDTLKRLVKADKEIAKSELCEDACRKDLMSMIRTCVANETVILQLLKQQKFSDKVELEFKYHPWWPIMQLVKGTPA
ncbi:Mak10 subunit, NatC N-terminal acetyltransferase-domain-containing protein [Gongronella butleri]|nr:Mak10 subunit, NatC N-terminal acetyltransferase-domain-containing protein [Gongronella butleri]